MRAFLSLLTLSLLLLVSACAAPPDSAYVTGKSTRTKLAGVSLGSDAAGKKCEQQAQPGGDAFIFCGEWSQPSAHVSPAQAGNLTDLALASPWRTALDRRFDCAPPRPVTVLGGDPAMLLDCRRKLGGWPQVGMVALVSGKAYFADGLQPELPVIERSIGILSGRLAPEAAPTVTGSEGLAAERLAAQSFSSSDIGQYDELMVAGMLANRAQNYISAEKAYRSALALQQKALGVNNPNTISPLMHQAVQLSNQGRYAEADALFARAEVLARSPELSDKSAAARLTHYRVLHLINQNKLDEALVLSRQAEAEYAALLPSEMLSTKVPTRTPGAGALADRLAAQELLADPTSEAALMGVLEMRRNRANILKWQGKVAESQEMAQSAIDLARARGWSQPVVTARLLRTSAQIAAADGNFGTADSELSASASAFNRVMPGARPGADTELLRAASLMRLGKVEEAVDACRKAAQTLQSLKSGTATDLLAPCLSGYAALAGKNRPDRQSLLVEMFETAQLGQSSATSQQIARASARLSENARDNRVGEAIRVREDAASALAALYRERDSMNEARRSGAQPGADSVAELDTKIAKAQEAEAEADSALQAASPNYGQLVQQVVKAKDVFAILRPGEAFAATLLGDDAGWTFLLRNGAMAISPIIGGAKAMATLVTKLRAGIEPTSGSTPPTFDVGAARALYTALFGGVGKELEGATSLTVAPTGPLLAFPFAVLLTGPADAADLADAPWLIRKMTITHVPAAANFVALRKVAGGSQAQHPWFGFGDFQRVSLHQAEASFPVRSCGDSARLLAGLPLLPGARAELDQARLLEDASGADQLLGSAYTADAVRKANLQNYRILHFATHALLSTDLACQDEPAIVASTSSGAKDASGALLTASAVAQLKLDADTVILSACNTGGPNGGGAGESLSGLARSFFYAGARSLLVTHWPVNDQITRILVVNTLKNYKENDRAGLASALSVAQRGLLSMAKGNLALLAHPYYWAPLALIGESNPAGAVASREVSGPRLAGL